MGEKVCTSVVWITLFCIDSQFSLCAVRHYACGARLTFIEQEIMGNQHPPAELPMFGELVPFGDPNW